jgi:hypothetical protein
MSLNVPPGWYIGGREELSIPIHLACQPTNSLFTFDEALNSNIEPTVGSYSNAPASCE